MEEWISCSPDYATWPATEGEAQEQTYPMNCLSWYQAFAFCIWDGGRLPTEAEWEKAAAGGDENRLYPWGSELPNANNANWRGSANSPFLAVGSYQGSNGEWNGRWGHADLAGSLWEWTLDSFDIYTEADCSDCASLITASSRMTRGGCFEYYVANSLRSAYRDYRDPASRGFRGVRCSRTAAAE